MPFPKVSNKAFARQRLIHWINERERIRLAKEAGKPRPWTQDPILAEWRFCNVNRCDDRETRWIFDNIIAKHSDSPVLWFNLSIARLINWSPTLAKLGYFDSWDRWHFINVMKSITGKVYTGAYMIPAGPSGMEKYDFQADYIYDQMWRLRGDAPRPGSSCAEWGHFLGITFRGVGDFLANQIVTDLRYTHHLRNAYDWETFVLAGPGTQRGLNRLLGFKLESKWVQSEAAEALNELRHDLSLEPSLDWAKPVFRDINNLSNCMCEFDKYSRVIACEGKPRSRYEPFTGA
jgi:hypothetical protein